MKFIDFTHIEDPLLRENAQHVWSDITELIWLLLDTKKFESIRLENCLRKTIIIYTASILEALLRLNIQRHLGPGKVSLNYEWGKREMLCPKENKEDEQRMVFEKEKGEEEHRIVLVKETRERKGTEQMNFNGMILLCRENNLLNSSLLDDLDTIRNIRNGLHIGGLAAVIKTYSQEDMDFALDTVRKMVEAMQ